MTQFVTARVNLTPDFLSSILITAFDGMYGGCWYWAEPSANADDSSWLTYERLDEDNAVWNTVTIIEKDPDDKSEVMTVDHATLANGLQMVLDAAMKGESHPTWVSAILAQEAGDIDSDAADVIVQYGVFGEVKYG